LLQKKIKNPNQKKIKNPNQKNIILRKIARVYNPNLVMIQQRYKSRRFGCQKYFYALAAKFEISENKTMIVMASPNINDHNSKSKKPFENTIIEDANLLKIDIDSEKDIKQGKLKKTFANLIGYIIEKHDGHVDIIYIESIGRYVPSFLKRMIKKALNKSFLYMICLSFNIIIFFIYDLIFFIYYLTVINYKDLLFMILLLFNTYHPFFVYKHRQHL
ncbi:hypothetical protein, partial [Plasmodium yoelii yoelii]